MQKFNIPSKDEVSRVNQNLFDALKGKLGMVPNLYATMAYSDTGLENYLKLQQGKTSFSNKEKEAINLLVSQVNGCNYCLSAHTMLGKMNGFNDKEILELRRGYASFNDKLNSLVRLAKEIAETKGNPTESSLESFFNSGYSKGSLVDLVIAIADKVVMNYLHNITDVPIDFPMAPEL
ncbi:carboxymuconolactone decarboxylase family protein [Maribacter litoralis]|uniref:Alkyl hydroperoxide reductase AhpD n=1 Tax=Maribacter litoralis TaxID=2059726 RepID=A0A653XDD8_9FLAO|nr:carboxymuconolactone decarboxylase family protein [Maribacter litoralis]VXC28077.1 Alkyl hydroperoxide reductase AhpD [Maribacter litoralis]